jgi:dihydrofolate synthase/folylpolyglutamate synthase
MIDADVAVVCSIGLDHADWLGNTLEDIGREKAGIFRRARTRRTRQCGSAGFRCFRAIEEIGARAVMPGRDYHARAHGTGWDFEYGECDLRNLPMPALAGIHQLGNAATALAAIRTSACALTHTSVIHALRDVTLAGRFQRV